MGDRYILTVKCECGEIDDDVFYAPTCGFMNWQCPKCKREVDLEEYSGIDAESCANTEYGIKAVRELKKELNTNNVSKKTANPVVLSYLAGIVDGEGYIGITMSKYKYNGNERMRYKGVLCVEMCAKEVLQLFSDTFGSNIHQRQKKEGYPILYAWRVSAKRGSEILKSLLPYLINKKRQAGLLIKYQDELSKKKGGGGLLLTEHEIKIREDFYLQMKYLNSYPQAENIQKTDIDVLNETMKQLSEGYMNRVWAKSDIPKKRGRPKNE